MKKITILIILLGLLKAFASEPIKTSLEKSEAMKFKNTIMKAKVKKITAIKYEIVDRKETGKTSKIIEQEFDKNGNLLSVKTFDKEALNKLVKLSYDNDNNLIEEIEYDSNGKIAKKTLYNYKEGRIQSYEVVDLQGKVIESVIFKYSEDKKRIISEKLKEGKYLEYSTQYIYKDDFDKYNPYEVDIFSEDGNLQQKMENQYDVNQRLLDRLFYDKNGKVTSSLRFSYDKNGNNTKIAYLDNNQNVQYYDEFKFNEKNLCIEIKRYINPERILTKIVNKYEFYD